MQSKELLKVIWKALISAWITNEMVGITNTLEHTKIRFTINQVNGCVNELLSLTV